MLLSAATCQLLIVDMQARLLPAMAEPGAVLSGVTILAQAATRLAIPVAISEHCADKIGDTVPEVLAAAPGATRLAKTHFSALREAEIAAHLAHRRAEGRAQLLLCGIEAHVCVLQTALDALTAGYEVFVAADAIMSRREASRATALARLTQAGIAPVTVEMALFEWLGKAGGDDFKALSALIR